MAGSRMRDEKNAEVRDRIAELRRELHGLYRKMRESHGPEKEALIDRIDRVGADITQSIEELR